MGGGRVELAEYVPRGRKRYRRGKKGVQQCLGGRVDEGRQVGGVAKHRGLGRFGLSPLLAIHLPRLPRGAILISPPI